MESDLYLVAILVVFTFIIYNSTAERPDEARADFARGSGNGL